MTYGNVIHEEEMEVWFLICLNWEMPICNNKNSPIVTFPTSVANYVTVIEIFKTIAYKTDVILKRTVTHRFYLHDSNGIFLW